MPIKDHDARRKYLRDYMQRRREELIKSAESSRSARVRTVEDEVRNPARQGVGFAGPGTGNHQKRATKAQFPSETPCSTARRCSVLRVSRLDATGMIESFCGWSSDDLEFLSGSQRRRWPARIF